MSYFLFGHLASSRNHVPADFRETQIMNEKFPRSVRESEKTRIYHTNLEVLCNDIFFYQSIIPFVTIYYVMLAR